MDNMDMIDKTDNTDNADKTDKMDNVDIPNVKSLPLLKYIITWNITWECIHNMQVWGTRIVAFMQKVFEISDTERKQKCTEA